MKIETLIRLSFIALMMYFAGASILMQVPKILAMPVIEMLQSLP